MLQKKFYSESEDYEYLPLVVVFGVIWYVYVIKNLLTGADNALWGALFVIGFVFPYYIFTTIKKVRTARDQHQAIIQSCSSFDGKIIDAVREEFIEQKNKREYRTVYYYLLAEISENNSDEVKVVKSQRYLKPLHLDISSPDIKVYYDAENDQYIFDEFKFKKSRKEPNIPLRSETIYEETPGMFSNIIKIFFLACIIYFLLVMFELV